VDDKDVRKDYGPREGAAAVVVGVCGAWVLILAGLVGLMCAVHG
jgi:hypothetical protein